MFKRILQVIICILITLTVFCISNLRVEPPTAQAQCVSWRIYSSTTAGQWGDPCPAGWVRNQPAGNPYSPSYATYWYTAICAQ